MRSSYKNFGGMSAIRVASDGAHFIALNDKGWWFRGRIVYEGSQPIGIVDAEMAPMLGADGQPLAAHGWYDTESIAEDGGTLYVGIERVHQIVRFDYGKEGLLARGRPIAPAAGISFAAVQPRSRSPGLRPQGLSAWRHADRDLGARPRRCRQYQRLPAGRPEPGRIHGQAQLELRRQRRCTASRRRPSAAGTQVQLDQRLDRPDTAHRAGRDQARRDGGRPRSVRGGPRLRDRQHGRPERPPQSGGEIVLTLISDDNFLPFSARCCCSSRSRSRECGGWAGGMCWRVARDPDCSSPPATPPRRASSGFGA